MTTLISIAEIVGDSEVMLGVTPDPMVILDYNNLQISLSYQ